MNFISDNAVGVAPEIMQALAEANRGPSMPYGADDWTKRVERRFAEIFEHEVRVFPVATGTAANALSLACLTRKRTSWRTSAARPNCSAAERRCGPCQALTAS